MDEQGEADPATSQVVSLASDGGEMKLSNGHVKNLRKKKKHHRKFFKTRESNT